MVCAKCGALVDDNLSVCDNCGYVFEDNVAQAEIDGSEYNINPNTPALPDAFEPVRERKNFAANKISFLFALCVAVAVVILTFYGTHYITDAGIRLSNIQSSSASSFFGFGSGDNGDYYRYIGVALYGISYALKSIGVAFAGIVLLCGIRKND